MRGAPKATATLFTHFRAVRWSLSASGWSYLPRFIGCQAPGGSETRCLPHSSSHRLAPLAQGHTFRRMLAGTVASTNASSVGKLTTCSISFSSSAVMLLWRRSKLQANSSWASDLRGRTRATRARAALVPVLRLQRLHRNAAKRAERSTASRQGAHCRCLATQNHRCGTSGLIPRVSSREEGNHTAGKRVRVLTARALFSRSDSVRLPPKTRDCSLVAPTVVSTTYRLAGAVHANSLRRDAQTAAQKRWKATRLLHGVLPAAVRSCQ